MLREAEPKGCPVHRCDCWCNRRCKLIWGNGLEDSCILPIVLLFAGGPRNRLAAWLTDGGGVHKRDLKHNQLRQNKPGKPKYRSISLGFSVEATLLAWS